MAHSFVALGHHHPRRAPAGLAAAVTLARPEAGSSVMRVRASSRNSRVRSGAPPLSSRLDAPACIPRPRPGGPESSGGDEPAASSPRLLLAIGRGRSAGRRRSPDRSRRRMRRWASTRDDSGDLPRSGMHRSGICPEGHHQRGVVPPRRAREQAPHPLADGVGHRAASASLARSGYVAPIS
jgi:hypothetical protein